MSTMAIPATTGDWVRTARLRANKTQEQLGDLLGVTKANVSGWENNRHDPSYAQMVKISQLTGEPLPMTQGNVTPSAIGTRRLPILDNLQAGKWSDVSEGRSESDISEYLLTSLDLSPSAFAMRIQGRSMLPAFEEGDVVVLDPAVAPRPGDYVCALNGSGQATFKKYRVRGITKSGAEVFELCPLNPDYPTLRSDTSDLKVIAVMMEHRKYRTK